MWKYRAGSGLLKREGGWHFSYLIFSSFVIFTFRNYSLQNFVMRIHHNFMKKSHSKLSKNEPEKIP